MPEFQQVLVMIGLSGSGKTTFARQYCAERPGWVRLSKDDLRRAVLPGALTAHWQKAGQEEYQRIELLINDMQADALRRMLAAGMHVVVDNTHLRLPYIQDILRSMQGFSVELRFHFTDTPIDECIRRDAARADQVGAEIIRKQAEQLMQLRSQLDFRQVWRIEPPYWARKVPGALPTCVLVDIDGTLAIRRKGPDERRPFDWQRVGEDLPRVPVLRLLHMLRKADCQLIFVSGRDEICRHETLQWLSKYLELPTEEIRLYMRRHRDNRKDSIVKRELFEAHIAGRYEVMMVLDDRNQVVEMWRKELGLTCLQVEEGGF